MTHDPNDLIMLFNDLFREPYRTVLVKGGAEPEYLPADNADGFAQIIFAHDYYASALHEISHWCIAGEQRRTLRDYGYWYCPDGRSRQQQQEFEAVEVRPQALEWLFSVAAGSRFHISVDNLSGDGGVDEVVFRNRVRNQAEAYLVHGMPRRAQRFFNALGTFYGAPEDFRVAWNRETGRAETQWFETDTEVS
ncbi:elongation factor P hydroxylase [Marinobacter confluentis]|uniref:Elongation factor P hydroxylase n=1 Tax=Marinobacter confluentis TaxID=1697557 RepID=A0A4Z1CBI4_9GAMM|nr:elongation factor P hydroxylase [Marinobacter confluentis]TGN41416.1 elongation factor P hydroxylase [Marinobacter confluentis]